MDMKLNTLILVYIDILIFKCLLQTLNASFLVSIPAIEMYVKHLENIQVPGDFEMTCFVGFVTSKHVRLSLGLVGIVQVLLVSAGFVSFGPKLT